MEAEIKGEKPRKGTDGGTSVPSSFHDALTLKPPYACSPMSLKPLPSSCLSSPASSALWNSLIPFLSSLAIGLSSQEPKSCIPASLTVALQSYVYIHLVLCSCQLFVMDLQASGLSYLSLSFLTHDSGLTRILLRVFWRLNIKTLYKQIWHLQAII